VSGEPKTLTSALDAITKPLPDDARMQGYYIGFDRTGVGAVDAILSAVAWAGKGAHRTEDWTDESDFYLNRPGLPDAPTANDLIQNAANVAAEQIRALEVVARDDAAELRAALKQLLANPYPLTFTGDPLSHREGRARHEAAMRAARAALAATEEES